MAKPPASRKQKNAKSKLNDGVKSVNRDKATESHDNQQQPPSHGQQPKKIIRLFKTIWEFTILRVLRITIVPVIQWIDKHHGFMTFLATAVIAWLTWTLVEYSGKQWETMHQQLELSQRPWISAKHKITTPLVFDQRGARFNMEEMIENVGQSVALDVGSWVEMFPWDFTTQFAPANKRQEEWCSANRRPVQRSMTGYVMFPRQVINQLHDVGITTKQIEEVRSMAKPGEPKAVGLILVGCVKYRFSFESRERPTHQTRFRYLLDIPGDDVVNSAIPMSGQPVRLQLVPIPDGWTAD